MWLDPAFLDWSLAPEVAAGPPRPTLLIQGDDDPYGTLEQIDRIDPRPPPAATERLVLPGGHSLHLDAPEIVLGALSRWV